jgi:hypothetical protein
MCARVLIKLDDDGAIPIPKPITFPSQPPTERAVLVGVEDDNGFDRIERTKPIACHCLLNPIPSVVIG